MAGLKDAEGFEEFDVNKLCDWLRLKKASEDVINVVADNGIDGRTFLDLNGEDLKDLSNSFKVRKEIRRFLEQLNDDDSDACNTPPQFKKRKRSPSPDLPVLQRPTTKKATSFNAKLIDVSECFIPKSEILENYSHYSPQSMETERRRVVRLAMDNLIGQNDGRPSESEIQNLARMMASQYPCLRDRPLESLRDNFNSLVGFLRRRMYNVTPPVSTKGRKKGYAKPKGKDDEDHNNNIKSTDQENTGEQREPAEIPAEEAVKEKEVAVGGEKIKEKTVTRETEKIGEKKSQENSEKNLVQGECTSKEQEKTENKDQNTPADKSLVAALKKSTRPSTSEQLIRLTIAERLKEVEKIPAKERLKYTLNTYKVFSYPESVIFNMYMQVPVELPDMKQKLEDLMTTSLDLLFDKNILNIPRSAIKTTDQKYFLALFHLPSLCGNKSAGKLKPGHHLVHVVKSSEMWKEVAQSHKGTSGPWILHNTIGSNTSTTLMEREDVIFKCKNAEEAILAMLGLYYLGSLPYPSQITGPLLLLQHLVLDDKIHSGDLPTLQKAMKEFTAYKERSESHSLDSLF